MLPKKNTRYMFLNNKNIGTYTIKTHGKNYEQVLPEI